MGPSGMPGIKPESAMCKASTLPTELSLWSLTPAILIPATCSGFDKSLDLGVGLKESQRSLLWVSPILKDSWSMGLGGES